MASSSLASSTPPSPGKEAAGEAHSTSSTLVGLGADVDGCGRDSSVALVPVPLLSSGPARSPCVWQRQGLFLSEETEGHTFPH